jgi:hypothetical protein
MKHAVKPIHFVGMVDASRAQGSCLRDTTARERCQMPACSLPERKGSR